MLISLESLEIIQISLLYDFYKLFEWEKVMIFFSRTNKRKIPLRVRLSNLKDWTSKFYRKLLKPFIIGSSLMILIFIGFKIYVYLDTSPYFKLTSLEILGTESLDYADVTKACGITVSKTDLLFLDSSKISKKCETHPWISSAKITKNLPSDMTIIIKEEKAVALTSYGGLYLTNNYGEIFLRTEPLEFYDLPLITGIGKIVKSEGSEAGITAIKEAISLINDYSRNGLEKYDKILEVHANLIMGMTLFLTNTGTKIVVGNPPFTKKIIRLQMILNELSSKNQKADYILLNNNKKPYLVTLKLKKEEEHI